MFVIYRIYIDKPYLSGNKEHFNHFYYCSKQCIVYMEANENYKMGINLHKKLFNTYYIKRKKINNKY